MAKTAQDRLEHYERRLSALRTERSTWLSHYRELSDSANSHIAMLRIPSLKMV